jgi:hypothetical protein
VNLTGSTACPSSLSPPTGCFPATSHGTPSQSLSAPRNPPCKDESHHEQRIFRRAATADAVAIWLSSSRLASLGAQQLRALNQAISWTIETPCEAMAAKAVVSTRLNDSECSTLASTFAINAGSPHLELILWRALPCCWHESRSLALWQCSWYLPGRRAARFDRRCPSRPCL